MSQKQKKIFMAYLTKYALSRGKIDYVEVEQSEDSSMVRIVEYPHSFYHGEGREWHLTWDSAKNRVEELRKNKIKSLHKQIIKLEKMQFKKGE